jgi:membrane-associated phospholipid phosphatase
MSPRSFARSIAGGAILAAATLASSPARADQEKTVQWNENWPRVRVIEMVNIVALTIGSVLVHDSPHSEYAKWSGPILFDGPARSFLKVRTARGQEAAADVSNVLYRGMVLAPYVIDNYIAAMGVHQNADVALQLTLIDMQSLGLSGVLTLGVEHLSGRQRPYVDDCISPTGPTKTGFSTCGGVDDFQSFYSGHAAATFTMAALTCVHHQHLPLYGGGVPDAMACAVMMGLATTVGVTRLMADRHWASDIFVGAGVGILNGYLLPLWLHYGGGKAKIPTSVQTGLGELVPFPQVYDGGAGLGVAIF